MNDDSIGGLAGLTVVSYLVVSSVLDVLTRSARQTESFGWHHLGEAATRTAAYESLFGAADTVVLLSMGVGFGYVVGRELDWPDEFRRFLYATAGGATVVVAFLWLLGATASHTWGQFDALSPLLVTALVDSFVHLVAVFTICAVAGAAFAHAEVVGDSPPSPVVDDEPTD